MSIHTHPVPSFERNEKRTRIVVGITAMMMVAEIAAGFFTHSLALLADGWHMATHAGALGLSALAYWYARRANAEAYSFGTGKVLALAGFTNAIVLLIVALAMVEAAIERLLDPQSVRFDEALLVAGIGLLVNIVCAFVLQEKHDHPHDHDHHHDHHHHDHNMRSAYLHVLADALTSVLAILALVGGKWLGWTFLDPVVALAGSAVILHWGTGLAKKSAAQLLDANPAPDRCAAIRTRLEAMDTSVVDLHVWEIGPSSKGCIVSLVTKNPRPLADYRAAVLEVAPITHLTIEIDRAH
jgi:cation diffusion facilitator family transporter